MKCFAFLTLLMIVSYLLGFVNRPEQFQWMDKNFTTAIKGFAILTVVWAHSGARLGVSGIQFIAGIGVALFLICSGYGLEISYEKNGLKGFWKKRLLGVCLPFWLVELIGLLITQSFTVEKYVLDVLFLKPATSYGWFMGYIVICYLIFYATKRFMSDERSGTLVLIAAFAIWFIIDSLFFAQESMPFLRARQMVSFPCGVLIAKNKNVISQYLGKKKSFLIFVGGGIMCLLFITVTQLEVVKQLPYLISNLMALLTCFPVAIGLLAFGKSFGGFFENRMLIAVGKTSYEVYLVHAFTLDIVGLSVIQIFIFSAVTGVFSVFIYMIMGNRKIIKSL